MRGFGKPSIVLASECVGLVATILALALLLKPLGISGAAISSLLGYSGTSLALLYKPAELLSCVLENIAARSLRRHLDLDTVSRSAGGECLIHAKRLDQAL